MRMMILPAAVLLGACMGKPPLAAAPRMTVAVTDLALDTAHGRATLRERVTIAARRFCDLHGADVTPAESRADPWFCPDFMRSEIMGGMTIPVRKAYVQARREAGVRGRNL